MPTANLAIPEIGSRQCLTPIGGVTNEKGHVIVLGSPYLCDNSLPVMEKNLLVRIAVIAGHFDELRRMDGTLAVYLVELSDEADYFAQGK